MVKCLPEFEYFYCILENRNFTLKNKRSKVQTMQLLQRVTRVPRKDYAQNATGITLLLFITFV